MFQTGYDATGGGSCSGGSNNGCAPAFAMSRQGSGNCATTACTTATMSGNKIQNSVLKVNNFDGNATTLSYAAIEIPDNTGVTFMPHTNFANNVILDIANAGAVANYGGGSSGYGYAPLTCSGLASVAASSTNCQSSDPQFVSTCAYNAIGSCNLKPQASSPAVHAGTALPANDFDVVGTAFAVGTPSIGAYETAAGGVTPAVPPPSLSCDINGDGVINSLDVTAAINQALGVTPCGTADLQQNGQCNVVDVQRVINAVLGGSCLTGQ